MMGMRVGAQADRFYVEEAEEMEAEAEAEEEMKCSAYPMPCPQMRYLQLYPTTIPHTERAFQPT